MVSYVEKSHWEEKNSKIDMSRKKTLLTNLNAKCVTISALTRTIVNLNSAIHSIWG